MKTISPHLLIVLLAACQSRLDPPNDAAPQNKVVELAPKASPKTEEGRLVGNRLLSTCGDQNDPQKKGLLRAAYGEQFDLLCRIVSSVSKEYIQGDGCSAFLTHEAFCKNEESASLIGLLLVLSRDLASKGPAMTKGIQDHNVIVKASILKAIEKSSSDALLEQGNQRAEEHLTALWSLRQAWSTLSNSKCKEGVFHVALDVGHAKETPGARSARGRSEYSFNLDLVDLIEMDLKHRGVRVSRLNPSGGSFTLSQRKQGAAAVKADLLFSVHHDSVQASKLTEWIVNGKSEKYCDEHRGFSFFYSQSSKNPATSVSLAKQMGGDLTRFGFKPTAHHAEKIPGEGRELVVPEVGLYRRDGLGVLRHSKMTSLLFEAGVIVHREEELSLMDPLRRATMAASLAESISKSCIDSK